MEVALRGWNLKHSTIKLDTSPDGPARRRVTVPDTHGFEYEVGSLPELFESDPNDDQNAGPVLKVLALVNGRIDRSGDCDIYRVEAKAGQSLAVEILARRLGSPLDAVVHVATTEGRVLAWQDDRMSKDGHLHLDDGLLTHHADSRLSITPEADGPLLIRVSDARQAGGIAFGYRLKLTPLQPDFELRVSPSGVSTGAGRHTPISVHVLRRHGFNGEIELRLDGLPEGFGLSGGVIPIGAEGCRMTLDVPATARNGSFTPRLLGTATIGGKPVTREARPTDDRMQAFLWRHLVEAEEWLVQVRGKTGSITRIGKGPVHLPSGGTAVVHFKVWKDLAPRISTEPSAAPAGIKVSQPHRTKNGFTVNVSASEEMKPGQRFNLIVDLYPVANGRQSAKVKLPNNSLPALPILITQATTP